MKKYHGRTTFLGNPLTLLGEPVKTGDHAPDFTTIGEGLKTVRLSDFAGKKIIISAVPSVDTGVCAAQTRRLNL